MPTQVDDIWPALPQSAWSETCITLQLWMQIVGKVRLALMPAINHTWAVTLYPSIHGVSTSIMPYGTRTLQIDFDFRDHVLRLETSEGRCKTIPLQPTTVASFYEKVKAALDALDTPVRIWPVPVEVSDPIPFERDHIHQAYDPECARRFWTILLQTTRVFTIFRARYIGKVSPVHLFWGALDLACTRFSGRIAPEHPGVPGLPDRITRDAYSHEVSSCGFWPGAPGIPPFFYSYAYPEPPGYRECSIAPVQAAFDTKLGEFVLPYEAMRLSADPDSTLLEFIETTYDAAARCGHWDRRALEAATKTVAP
ncbi:DUF5996 family protein [Acidicapsa acidisoli]|uniref:DUF5996 family protein n=1 Tax=Acidicapsa acidisoli TaxID=1615681 RepID=UPI0021E0EC7F|nr:DUF5996 family protein [Acidicapsa acidisoli]